MTTRTYTAADWLAALDDELELPPRAAEAQGRRDLRPWQTYCVIAAVTQAPGALLLYGLFGVWWVVALALAVWLALDTTILLAAWRYNRL